MLTYNGKNKIEKNNTYTFDSIDKFCIPLPADLNEIMQNEDTLYSYNILVKPKNKSAKEKFKFTMIKNMNVAIYRFIKPITINNHFEITKWNPYDNYSGILRIYCKDTIIIKSNGIIDGSGCGYHHGLQLEEKEYKQNDNSEDIDEYLLKFGNGYNHNFGGGIIELISMNSIINEGKIECNGLYKGNGGSIKIKCKRFINKGIISAKKK
eukprot:353949_1